VTARPAFELAEVFRRHSEAYGRANAGHLGRIERRVIGAVAACRTAALGGHVEQCDDCGAVRIAYNSCLMGTSSNGELAHWRRRFSVNCSDPSLHNSAVLRLRRLGHPWPVTNGDEYVGDLLLGVQDAGASAERAERTIPQRFRSRARAAGV